MGRKKKIVESTETNMQPVETLQEKPVEKVLASEKPPELLITKITPVHELEIRDRKMVTGVFTIEGKKKGILRLGPMRKYPGEELKNKYFEHGRQYTIPQWMADWLNGVGNEEMKTPACRKITHTDQWVDLNDKRPLQAPLYQNLFRFTPVAKW